MNGMPSGTRALMQQVISGLLAGRSVQRAPELGRQLVQRLRYLESTGEVWATECFEALAYEAATQQCGRYLRELDTVTVAYSGDVVSMPARYAVAAKTQSGVKQGRQYELWINLTWAEYDALIATLLSQAESIFKNVKAFQEIGKLRLLYPASTGPREACVLAGIDPANLDLEGVS